MRCRSNLILGAVAAALALTACKKQPTTALTTVPAQPRTADTAVRAPVVERTAATTPDAPAEDRAPGRGPIYYPFDNADLSDDGRALLGTLGAWLGAHAGATVVLAGHADDRGTTEYNLALGERRAQVAQQYLVRLGIAAGRVSTISYGEERPAVEGVSEASWQQNRRVEISISAP
jgi:peptidoglycan-associated lipoprotein